MKNIIKLVNFLSIILFASAEDHLPTVEPVPLKPLTEAMEKGGLARVNFYLDEGGKWPCITTDSLALKNKIQNQKELVALSDRLTSLIRERVEAEPSSEIAVLESEAKMYFSLGRKLRKADGYRNIVVSLLCNELAAHRCGKIIILSHGEKLGPKCPEIFKDRNSDRMLNLFIALIPEHSALSNSGLGELLVEKRVTGDTWLEMIVALREIEIQGSTVGEKYNETVVLPFTTLMQNFSNENISAVVFDYGWEKIMHESVIPALAMYLKNGGSLDTLLKETANATKYREIMKNGTFSFSLSPVMTGHVDASPLAVFVKSIQSTKELSKRLFGEQK
jgi:hypothetical protein